MRTRERLLGRWASWAGGNPGKAVLLAVAVTAVMAVGATLVQLEMTFFSVMPQNLQQVQDLETITEEFPIASSIVVVVDGRSLGEGQEVTERVKDTVDALESEFTGLEWSEAVVGVWGRFPTDYFEDHGLLLSDTEQLRRIADLYADLELTPLLAAINDDLEREYAGDADAMSDDESLVVSWARGLSGILDQLAAAAEGGPVSHGALDAALDEWLVGDPYYLSRDERMALVFIEPTFTMNDLGPLVQDLPRIDETAAQIAAEYGVTTGLTGMIVVAKDEMLTSEQGIVVSMLVAVVLILTLMIIVFRMRSVPFITGIPLLVGVFWTVGMTGFALGRLNIMTAMYLVALLGLGIDYAVHLLTGFIQERDDGKEFLEALSGTLRRAGPGILTGAFTTAAAFFALVISESQVIRELAIVAGGGILCELVAMLILVPAILGIRQRRLERKGRPDPAVSRKITIRSDWADGIGKVVSRAPIVFAVALLAIGIGLGTQAGRVTIEDNLMNMEAKGLESVELQEVLVQEFGNAPDALYVITDQRREMDGLVEQLEALGTVRTVDSIVPWWPEESEQTRRQPLVEAMEERFSSYTEPSETLDQYGLLDELYRLEMNLVELGDMAVLEGMDRIAFVLNSATGLDTDGTKVAETAFDRLFAALESDEADTVAVQRFQSELADGLAGRLASMANPDPISRADLPSDVADSYISRDGENYLITVVPRQNAWVSDFREVFTSQIDTVTPRATGMILAADELIRIARQDGRRAMIAALIAVFIILLFDFRNLRLTLISFLPLGLSFITLFGLMAVTGIKIDFINIIAIPLLVGIGIDDTVHINHRYLREGRGGIRRTIARTGTAVAMTTVTTMIGFASFIPSVMTAMRSTGVVLTVAMALAFIFSVFLHPAILKIVCEYWGWNLGPRIGPGVEQVEAKQ
jgi:predicted RND superfamily exporter protein